MNTGEATSVKPATSDGVSHDSLTPLVFWLGFPAVLGLFSGWNQIGMVAPFLTPAWSMIYWLLLSAVMWSGLGLGTALISRMGRRWSLWLKLSVGAVVGVALTRPVHASFQALFLPLTTNPGVIRALPALPITLTDWRLLFGGNVMLMLFWIGGALFFSRFLGFAPFATISAARETVAPPAPAQAPLLASRLNRLHFDDVDAIQAEDHYLRLSGSKGEELILYRFADAVAELTPRGWTRVHRSFAVRDAAVKDRFFRGRYVALILSSGQQIPVSERYRAMTERLGAPATDRR
jgi:LytTr DNA-binding domain